MIELAKITALFAITAVAEIAGCYLPWLVTKQDKTAWLLIHPLWGGGPDGFQIRTAVTHKTPRVHGGALSTVNTEGMRR